MDIAYKFRVEKLDRRHTGYPVFTHRITIVYLDLLPRTPDSIYHDMSAMDQFWQKFGPSVPLNNFLRVMAAKVNDNLINRYWAFRQYPHSSRHYFYLTEAGYTAFALEFL